MVNYLLLVLARAYLSTPCIIFPSRPRGTDRDGESLRVCFVTLKISFFFFLFYCFANLVSAMGSCFSLIFWVAN